jgi:hypothetical protein
MVGNDSLDGGIIGIAIALTGVIGGGVCGAVTGGFSIIGVMGTTIGMIGVIAGTLLIVGVGAGIAVGWAVLPAPGMQQAKVKFNNISGLETWLCMVVICLTGFFLPD